MKEIAPGYILQRMYLKKRLKAFANNKQTPLTFCEIGTGKGGNSGLLLSIGINGVGYELNPESCKVAEQYNRKYIDEKRYSVINADFITAPVSQKFDIIFTSMVIEHLSPQQVNDYFKKCKENLNQNGIIISLVPANMKYWGIEDEIAGHYKRYTFECFNKIAETHHFKINHTAGLTFPLSNWLLSLSNFLVKKSESNKKEMTMQERTELSGNRDVMFKTVYPAWFGFFLNEITMLPFYWLQLLNLKNEKSLVIYNELK